MYWYSPATTKWPDATEPSCSRSRRASFTRSSSRSKTYASSCAVVGPWTSRCRVRSRSSAVSKLSRFTGWRANTVSSIPRRWTRYARSSFRRPSLTSFDSRFRVLAIDFREAGPASSAFATDSSPGFRRDFCAYTAAYTGTSSVGAQRIPRGVQTLWTVPASMSSPPHARRSGPGRFEYSNTLGGFCCRRFKAPTRARRAGMSSFRSTAGSFRRKYSFTSSSVNCAASSSFSGTIRRRICLWSSRRRADRSSIRTRSLTPARTTLCANGEGRFENPAIFTSIRPFSIPSRTSRACRRSITSFRISWYVSFTTGKSSISWSQSRTRWERSCWRPMDTSRPL